MIFPVSSGSLAFVRAVHEEPPMKPLFPNWYHIQNDELLGSWLFLIATFPIIPYALIYLAASGENVVYLAALGIAVLVVAGTCLFVRACYPQDDNKVSSSISLLQYVRLLIVFYSLVGSTFSPLLFVCAGASAASDG